MIICKNVARIQKGFRKKPSGKSTIKKPKGIIPVEKFNKLQDIRWICEFEGRPLEMKKNIKEERK